MKKQQEFYDIVITLHMEDTLMEREQLQKSFSSDSTGLPCARILTTMLETVISARE